MLSIEDRDLPDRSRSRTATSRPAEAEERLRQGSRDLPRLQREVFLLRAQEGQRLRADRRGARHHAGGRAGALPPRGQAIEGAGAMTQCEGCPTACRRWRSAAPRGARRAGPPRRVRGLPGGVAAGPDNFAAGASLPPLRSPEVMTAGSSRSPFWRARCCPLAALDLDGRRPGSRRGDRHRGARLQDPIERTSARNFRTGRNGAPYADTGAGSRTRSRDRPAIGFASRARRTTGW